MTLLESLKKYSVVVADTGDIEAIARLKPQDATTNPSLLYSASQRPEYRQFVDEAVEHAEQQGGNETDQSFCSLRSVSVRRESKASRGTPVFPGAKASSTS